MPVPKAAPSPESPSVSLPAETIAQLIATVEKLHERVDRDPTDDGSRALLTQILEQHGVALKSALRPENQLHPDISYLNPEGERNHPRPRLKRPAFLLGVPLAQESLSREEIDALNRFAGSLEVPGKRWQARILRDKAGSEVLYISVPFRSFDDLRGIGGLLNILNTIHGSGKRPDTSDVLLERLEAAERTIAELQAKQVAQPDAPLPNV